MKSIMVLILFPLVLLSQQVRFDDYFTDNTMRIDYYHSGDSDEEFFTLNKIYKQGTWAGTTKNLVDPFNLGKYYVKVYDCFDNALIYSRGFATYFGEYQTTDPAKDGINKTFHETLLIPYPKSKVLVVLESRDGKNILKPIHEWEIDPEDYHINTETPDRGDKVIKIIDSGSPHQKVDLVIVGEGYTKNDVQKFEKDLKKYSDIFFTIEPFKSNKKNFNVTGILRPSAESGADEPTKGIYKNTVMNATFNSMDSPRYLLTEDNKTVRDIAGQVPYDLAYIMVNIERYGGGGIYNTLGLFTASEVKWNEYVFVHEFGHFFAALADEYYTSSVAYDEFYPKGIEPLEANITALLDPNKLKWKDLLSPGIGVPTNWGKAKFDSLNNCIGHLRKVQKQELESSDLDQENRDRITKTFADSISETYKQLNDFVSNHPLRGKIGVFEGAGYSSEGLYRPTINSIMHKFDEKDWSYYKVSERQLQKMIDYYCE
jgi:hypothetical protein